MPHTKRIRPRPVILVVESSDDVREMYCTYLTYTGYDCVPAADGEEAMRLVREHVPDAVLLESSMPGVDGWDVAQIIKSDPLLRSIAVVMVASDVFDAHRRRADTVGVDAFIAKPVLPDELGRLLRRALKGRGPLNEGSIQ